MTHLNPDELIDAMEGMLAAERQTHLATCEHCRRELAELSSVLGEARHVRVPDPSPMFWQHFSARVTAAIDDDVKAGSNRPAWLRWQVLLPLGAVATIVLALMLAVPRHEAAENLTAQSAPAAPVAPVSPVAPDNWVMLADLVGDIDLDTAAAAGVSVTPGLAEQAVLELTAEEQQELTRLLKVELMRAKS